MDFDWSPEEEEFRKALRSFVEERIPEEWHRVPVARYVMTEADRERTLAFTHALGARGWLTPHWPQEYGGSGMPTWHHVILGEEMWSVGEPRGPQYMSVNWIGPAIIAFGTEQQKAFHLARIARGDAFWCQGFSEPDAGSDLASLRTSAVLDGDHYIVNGQKIWTSHTPSADWCFLLVRTDPGAQGKRHHHPAGSHGQPGDRSAHHPESGGGGRVCGGVPDRRKGACGHFGWVPRTAAGMSCAGLFRTNGSGRPAGARRPGAGRRGRLGRRGRAARRSYVLTAWVSPRAACEAARYLAYSVIDERARGETPSAQAYVARIAMVRADKLVAETVL